MVGEHAVEGAEARPAAAAASEALEALLAGNAEVLVAAIAPEGMMVPLPASVERHGQRVFEGRSGIDLVVAADQQKIFDVWARIKTEPVVVAEVHLIADPDVASTLHVFDLRAEHGVFVSALEAPDPDRVISWAASRAAGRGRVGHVKRDALGVFLEIDEGAAELLGWPVEQLVGRPTYEIVHPDDVERAIDGWMALRARTGSSRARVRYRQASGQYVWLEVTNDNRLDDPDFGCVLSDVVDISDEMAQLEALRDRERLLARLAEALPIGICHLRPDREVVYSNEPMGELLGEIDSIEALVGGVATGDRHVLETAIDAALQGRSGNLEVGVIRGYEERRCELTFRTMTAEDGGVDGVIVCAADVTDRSRLRAELEHRASHDALSGCLNRAATVTALERALRESRFVAVAYIDLDHFKAVNDELGHATGDELLRVAAARLRSVTRVGDRLGRLGGDEFVAICPRGEGPFEAAALAARLTEAVNGDVVFARQRIPLRASVGVTIATEGELDAEAVLQRADAAMYAVKRKARAQASGLTALRDLGHS